MSENIDESELEDCEEHVECLEDFDDGIKNLTEYTQILCEIAKNTMTYDNYVKLIDVSFKLDDIDKIRNAYEIFSSVFPVSPNLWLKYIQIECSLMENDSDISRIEEIFKKSLKDYYSVDIAFEFAQFACKAKIAQKIWPELLASYATDVMEGGKFFTLYRQFIENQDIESEEKLTVIIGSFAKQIELPLEDLAETHLEFLQYVENISNISDYLDLNNVENSYKKSKKNLKKILTFEEQLKKISPTDYSERLHVYEEYIKVAENCDTKHLPSIIYERMVADCCLDENCWINYSNYLEKNFDNPNELKKFSVFSQTPLDINTRGLRNCYWSEKLYIQRFHILEKLNTPLAKVKEVLESALKIEYSNPEKYVTLWIEYLSYLKRQTSVEDKTQVEYLRKTFHLSQTSLEKKCGEFADSKCKILQFWGQLEYEVLDNPSKGKELWLKVLENPENMLKSELWIEFIHLEKVRNLESAREYFYQALTTSYIDNPYIIGSSWVRFERCNGSLEQLKFCQNCCKSAFRKHFRNDKKFKNLKNKINIKFSNTANATPVAENKSKKERRQILPVIKEIIQKPKAPKGVEPNTVFVRNIPTDSSAEELKNIFKECGQVNDVRIVYNRNGTSKGLAYVEFEQEIDANSAVLKFNKYNLKNCEMLVAISAPPSRNVHKGANPLTRKREAQPDNTFNKKRRLDITPKLKNENVQQQSNNNTKKTNDDFRKLFQKN